MLQCSTLWSLSDPNTWYSARGNGVQCYGQTGESYPWESRALPLLSERDARLLGSAMLPLLDRESPSAEERETYERWLYQSHCGQLRHR